jgi:signal transduction histidine kinase
LDNAIKYSPDNPDVKIIYRKCEQGIVVHVEDKGIGISKANQKKYLKTYTGYQPVIYIMLKGLALG